MVHVHQRSKLGVSIDLIYLCLCPCLFCVAAGGALARMASIQILVTINWNTEVCTSSRRSPGVHLHGCYDSLLFVCFWTETPHESPNTRAKKGVNPRARVPVLFLEVAAKAHASSRCFMVKGETDVERNACDCHLENVRGHQSCSGGRAPHTKLETDKAA